MLGRAIAVTALICLVGSVGADEEVLRPGRSLALFNVVKFPNDQCTGDSRNGTCYTKEECSNKGGSSSGDCADGFGVCCVFSLGCGGSASENNTYLVMASTSSPTSPCTYEVCKCNSNICRIRLDFTTFTLAAPSTGTTVVPGVANTQAATGNCVTDQFSVASGSTTPVICGTNSGDHMIVDATQMCTKINFGTTGTATTRQWDIRVTQHECGSLAAGPPGCLQYFTGDTGTIQSFNFPTTTTIASSATHLASQMYTICIRRNSGKCGICYAAIDATGIAAVGNQASFGLSATNDAAKAGVITQCSLDYIGIVGGAATPGNFDTNTVARFCGRFLATVATATANATVCTKRAPFQVNVNFDDTEISSSITASTNEAAIFPGGIIGFKLNYVQQTTC